MKQISLIEKEQTLDFVISLPVSKIKEIKFELKKDEKKVKEINKELNKLFLDLKNEINSIIIGDNNNYNESLKNWINPKAFIRAEILYRLTRDGEEISTFHKLCDNKGETLTLMETEEGNKVGIFTPLSWDNQTGEKMDMETFIFNLNKCQKYKKYNNKKKSIYCDNSFGPWVYRFGFYNSKMKKVKHQGLDINTVYENGSDILPNKSNSDKYFNLKEVEVFKILIE